MASSRPTAFETAPEREASGQRWAIKLDFVDSNPGVQPTGQDRTAATISYFKGSQDQWHTGLPTFARLMYADLWPGIDLVYAGTVDRLKYIFVVKPGADPAQIKLAYRGAKTVRLSDVGQLEVSTPVGSFVDDAPHAYQEVEGRRVKVATAYALHAGEAVQEGAQVYGFQVGVYDAGRPLVLDPAVLIYAGYIGGSGDDCGSGIAADSGGNAYVTGLTDSTEAAFPVQAGPDLTYNGGTYDAFVAKVNAAGVALIYAGYMGGSGEDFGFGIAVDSGGNAYVSGSTSSSESTFPVTAGPDLTYNGDGDAFVAKVNEAGTALTYAGYIGGSGHETGFGIAVDSGRNAYVTGSTDSTESTFPVTAGPDLTYNGGRDTFVAKIFEPTVYLYLPLMMKN